MKFKRNFNYNMRKAHRYLGVFIGIQFLFWTLGGLYFSWNNMDDVHGETLLKQEKTYFADIDFAQIQKGLDSLKNKVDYDSIHSIKIIEVFGKPLAQLKYFDKHHLKVQLISAGNGELRPPFTGQECIQIVEEHLKESIPIVKAELFEKHTIGMHHEYRGKLLPAYAFTLDHPSQTTIYISTESGQITSVRNNNWRRFDFLWMLHTMDYKTRDHITNWVLRVFSVLGLLTILSGFTLFYITSPTIRRFNKKPKK
jgi:hypothetical protein